MYNIDVDHDSHTSYYRCGIFQMYLQDTYTRDLGEITMHLILNIDPWYTNFVICKQANESFL